MCCFPLAASARQGERLVLQMDTKQIGTDEFAEWIELERKCCPFFRFEIRWTPKSEAVWLNLSGPQGVKDFILDEFGLR
jgi:hypothetical protein